jgi:lathosterol oxidase
MDYVLSLADTVVFDKAYATLLPRHDLDASGFGANATFSQKPVEVDFVHQYLNLQPSQDAYMSQWDRENLFRQYLSLNLIVMIFGAIIYFVFATLSYIFVFDKDTFKHPKYLKNQMRQEIWTTLQGFPLMAMLTSPFFMLEIHGYSFLYENIDDYGLWYLFAQFPIFLMFTDFGIYWIHRGLHHPLIYKQLHKKHHKWIMPTPYASHAFHPVDGWAQSVPYHIFPLVLPLHKASYLVLFTFINIWTVMIHDGEYIANSPIINGAACHTMHHLYFNFNYGQFTTLWDRLGGSYRKPNMELFYRETKMNAKEWEKQSKEMETIVKDVEGDDTSFREYANADDKKQQ